MTEDSVCKEISLQFNYRGQSSDHVEIQCNPTWMRDNFGLMSSLIKHIHTAPEKPLKTKLYFYQWAVTKTGILGNVL